MYYVMQILPVSRNGCDLAQYVINSATSAIANRESGHPWHSVGARITPRSSKQKEKSRRKKDRQRIPNLIAIDFLVEFHL